VRSGGVKGPAESTVATPSIRGSHSSTFQLNLSILCGVCGVRWGVKPSVTKTAQVELESGGVEAPAVDAGGGEGVRCRAVRVPPDKGLATRSLTACS
jgi:hypothetical protein